MVEKGVIFSEIYACVIGSLASFAFASIAVIGMKRRSRLLLWTFFMSAIVQTGLFIWNMIRTNSDWTSNCYVPVLVHCLMVCGAIAFVTKITTIWSLVHLMAGFEKSPNVT